MCLGQHLARSGNKLILTNNRRILMNLLKCNEVNIISRYDRRRPWEKFSSTKIKYIVSQKPKWLFAHFVFFYLFATASNAVYTPLIMNSFFCIHLMSSVLIIQRKFTENTKKLFICICVIWHHMTSYDILFQMMQSICPILVSKRVWTTRIAQIDPILAKQLF